MSKADKILNIIIITLVVILGFAVFKPETLLAPSLEVEETEPTPNPSQKGNLESGILEKIKEALTPDPNKIPTKLIIDVPFTPQAPFAEWEDPRQQDGCEEASLVMAWHWINGESLPKKKAKEEILAISNFEEELIGEFADTSMTDTVEIFKKYYKYDNIRIIYDFDAQGIKDELMAGNIVLLPTDGTILKNPYYTTPGPERHMILVKGFNDKKNQFITNDPGTRRGEDFVYDYEVVMSAIINYSTGLHAPLIDERKVGIVVGKVESL